MPDKYRAPSRRTLRWVEQALGDGAHVAEAVRLVGGLTADMDRLTVESRRGGYDVVLRRWPAGLTWATGLVEHESAVFTALADSDLPVPRLLAADPTGEVAGASCVLMTALAGEPPLQPTDMADCLRQMARTLVRIHDQPIRLEATDPHALDDTKADLWLEDEGLVHALLEAAHETGPKPAVFVHGDYHQLNVLWHHERLSGVVDWTYSGSGRREIDVGHCRLVLAVLFSAQVAEDFLALYEAEAGVRIDPRADIRAVLTFGPSWLRFIPDLIAGRAPIGPPGMPERVEHLLRSALARLG